MWQIFAAKAAVDIFSAYSKGEHEKRMAKIKAMLAEHNAKMLEQDAFEVVRIGFAKKAQTEIKNQQTISKQNVAYATADVDTSFGTAAMIQEEARLMGRLNVKDITDAAYAQALGYKQKAVSVRFQSQMDQSATEYNAEQRLTSSILEAGSNVAMAYYYKNAQLTDQTTSKAQLTDQTTSTEDFIW